jgi:ubiquinone/menaquinone biosynthesis C-methylase UbiE
MMALTMRQRAFRRALVDTVLAARPQTVLDVGCGTGRLAAQLAEADPSIHVHGIDGDETVLARARGRIEAFDGRVRLTHGRSDALPVADATVDVVVASLLLHHLAPAAKRRSLEEARRVLQPDGRIVVADWGRPHGPLMRAAFLGVQLLDGFATTRDHAAGRLPSLLAQAGFGSVEVGRRWRTLWGSLEITTAETNRT